MFVAFVGMDVPVQIGPKEGRFVLVNSKADIALDDVFLGSGKPYAPLAILPVVDMDICWCLCIACDNIGRGALGRIRRNGRNFLPASLPFTSQTRCKGVGLPGYNAF